MISTLRARGALVCACAIALLALVATTVAVPASLANAADGTTAAKEKAAKKKVVKKKCKKTHRLVKGKCVRKKKPKAPVKPKPVTPVPNPLSDADGDGIPYKWETAAAVTKPPASGGPKRCTAKQRLAKGKCVPKCKKGRVLKKGKCVKRKKKGAKRKGAKAKASVDTASVASLGADPNHKDIFVQVDYANVGIRQNAACSELDAIVAAFANAPVANPDGKTGIDLHIDAGISCPSRSYDLGGSRIMDAGACPGNSAIFNWIGANFPEDRIGTFHIAGFSPTACGGGGEGGAGELGGTKMSVFTDGPSFAHVLMHELGHNLGLDHPFPGQPNRISSMNTRLQVSDTGGGATEVLDYQRFSLPALDENALSETAGLSAPPAAHRFYILHWCADVLPAATWRWAWPGDGPIDWNCNSPAIIVPPNGPTIDGGTVSADVNGDGQIGVLPATDNEWARLGYRSGGQIGPR